MTEATPPAGGRPLPTHTVVIPPEVSMVSLLGAHDEMLRTIERELPRLDVHVRGNEVNMSGPKDDVALAERLIDEMLEVIAAGQPINRDAIERSVHMLRDQTRSNSASPTVTVTTVPSGSRAPISTTTPPSTMPLYALMASTLEPDTAGQGRKAHASRPCARRWRRSALDRASRSATISPSRAPPSRA